MAGNNTELSSTFHQFPKLPAELRFAIWEFAIDAYPPRVKVNVCITRRTTTVHWPRDTPAVFVATRESRRITRKRTTRRSFQVDNFRDLNKDSTGIDPWNTRCSGLDTHCIWFDPSIMVLEVRIRTDRSRDAARISRQPRDWRAILDAVGEPLLVAQHVHVRSDDPLEIHRGFRHKTLLEELTRVGLHSKMITSSRLSVCELDDKRYRFKRGSVLDEGAGLFHWFAAWRVRTQGVLESWDCSPFRSRQVFPEGQAGLPINADMIGGLDVGWDGELSAKL